MPTPTFLSKQGTSSSSMCPQRVCLVLKLWADVGFGEVPLYTVSFPCNSGNHLSLGKNATQHLQNVKPKPRSLPTLPNSLPLTFPLYKSSKSMKGMACTAVRSLLLLLLRAMVSGLGCQTLTHRHCTGELWLCFLPCSHCSDTSEKTQCYSSKSCFLSKWQLLEGNLTGSFPKTLDVSWNSISLGWHIELEQGWSKASDKQVCEGSRVCF